MTALHSKRRLDVGVLRRHAERAIAERLGPTRPSWVMPVRAVQRDGQDVVIRVNSGGNSLAVEQRLATFGYMTTSEGNPDGYGVAVRVYPPAVSR